MSKALVIGQVWPEPKSSAAGWNLLNIMHTLSTQYDVHFASAAAPSKRQHNLRADNIQCHQIALNDTSFDRWIAKLDPTLVIFDRFMVEEQFGWRVREQCPQAMTILDTEDIHCLRLGRQKAKPFDRAIALREIASIYRCDLSLVISDTEIAWLQQTFGIPAEKLHHFPLARERLREQPSFDAREGFATIGNFKHPPNADSVRRLYSLWPSVRKALPQANLYIYGAYADHSAMQMHQPKKGFHVVGPIEDAIATLAKHRVMIAPINFGAGMKGKFLDAMAAGLPSVTTPLGAEGFGSDSEWPGAVHEDDQNIVESSIQLYIDEGLWSDAQRRGNRLLERSFSPQKHTINLLSKIKSSLLEVEVSRETDFVGEMLRFQNHGYHKYLSRWIELKNQREQ